MEIKKDSTDNLLSVNSKKTNKKGKYQPKKKYYPKNKQGNIQNKTPHTQTTNNAKFRVIPLGGNEEVGRNMTIFEYRPNGKHIKDIVIVDMGLQWPEEDMPGIDYIIPNIKYLKGKEKYIRGVIITHGHYDHIGAVPHLIPALGNPEIYGTPLTLGIIAKRQEDFKKVHPLKLKSITTDTI